MTEPVDALETLGNKLCPWLKPAFAQLDAALQTSRLGHAWLIVAPAHMGKINLALALATRLLGVRQDPPAELEPKEALAALAQRHAPADHHADLHWLYPLEDKATISIEQVREATDALSLTAHGGGAKVVIIEPADALTTAASNALLKTLEEPSEDTYLLLLADEIGRLPATIRSRCQKLRIPRPAPEAVASWLGGSAAAAEAWRMSGGAPLLAAEITLSGESSKNRELLDVILAVSEDKISPQNAAAQWVSAATADVLAWLMRALHAEIRQRLASIDSTPVTDRAEATLHNPFRKLTLRMLFEQYDKAEKLASQTGSGVNMDLALQALLGGFVVNDKGRL